MELLYHYLWKNRLFGLSPSLDSGEGVEIIDPGLSNPDAGPDFFNAKVRMSGTEWIGNVEIHVRASDWYRHNHHTDTAYDSVILHVVGTSDREIRRTDGSPIAQMALQLPKDFFLTYAELKTELKAVRCSKRIAELPRLTVCDWIDSLGMERLHAKAYRILSLLELNGGDWNTAAFVVLARGLGFGLNAEPFEMLARSIPLKYLLRHSDNRLQLEAILFGQARLLPENPVDSYSERLKTEYKFLAAKYGLSPIMPNVWRFARTRPQNMPYRRIALLAAALSNSFPLPGLMRENAGTTDELRHIFDSWKLEGYWSDHYGFGIPADIRTQSLSRQSVDLLLINVAAPFLFASASRTADLELSEKASSIWTKLRPECNSIITTWKSVGLPADTAFDTQALIHLRREYCDRARCLSCRFGSALLRRHIRPASAMTGLP